MKKSSMLVAALLATAAFAGDALALNTTGAGGYNTPLGIRAMPITGVPINVGFIDAMTPIGPQFPGGLLAGQATCGYFLKWRDPLSNPLIPNAGASQLCLLLEVQNGLTSQGCPASATANIATSVFAGPATAGVGCGGYSAAGTAFPFGLGGGVDGINLFLTEAPVAGIGALSGLVVYPGQVPLAIGPM